MVEFYYENRGGGLTFGVEYEKIVGSDYEPFLRTFFIIQIELVSGLMMWFL